LINLAQNDDEIVSILLHEIAHVELRHTVQSVVQTSTLLLGVVVLTGDVTSLSTVLFAIPALLLDSGYSRRMEEQADAYSLDHMMLLNIDPIHFANIMLKISDSHKKIAESESSYWSSHPPTNERIGKFKVASREYNEKVEIKDSAE
jgi:Zn-dependent protease with chaperone function